MSNQELRAIRESVRILKPLASLPSLEDRTAYVYRHPIAVSNTCLTFGLAVPELREILAQLLPEFGIRLVEVAQGMQVSSNADRYPVGRGPIEAIWNDLEQGEISDDRALELVTERRLAGDLMYTYLKAVADHAYDSMVRGKRRLAAQRLRILVEATGQLSEQTSFLPASEIWQMRRVGGWFWLEAASTALVDLPDGRIFHHALACGSLLIEEAVEHGSDDERGQLLERLGVLHLDPYTVDRSPGNFEVANQQWKRKLLDELGDKAARAIESQWPMPEPKEALIRAGEFLGQAIATRDPGEKGTARAALVQCLYFRQHLGEPVTNEEIREQALAGLEELESTGEHEKVAKLKLVLTTLKDGPSSTT